MLSFRYGEFEIPFSKDFTVRSCESSTCRHVKVGVWCTCVLFSPNPCPCALEFTDSDPDKPDFLPLAVSQPAIPKETKPLTSVSHCAGPLTWLLFSLCTLRQERDKLLNYRDNMLYTPGISNLASELSEIGPKWDF